LGGLVSRLRPEANKDNSETAAQRKGKQFYFVALTWNFRRTDLLVEEASLQCKRKSARIEFPSRCFPLDPIDSTRLGDAPCLLQTVTLQLRSDCLNNHFASIYFQDSFTDEFCSLDH
jgi:hypothetical protein